MTNRRELPIWGGDDPIASACACDADGGTSGPAGIGMPDARNGAAAGPTRRPVGPMTDSLPFLAGGGGGRPIDPRARLVRTPARPPEGWPESLRTALALVLKLAREHDPGLGAGPALLLQRDLLPAARPAPVLGDGRAVRPGLGRRLGAGQADHRRRAGRAQPALRRPAVAARHRPGRGRDVVDVLVFAGARRRRAHRRLFILTNETTAQVVATRRLRESEANRPRERRAGPARARGRGDHRDVAVGPASDRFTVDEAFARSFGLDPALGREA